MDAIRGFILEYGLYPIFLLIGIVIGLGVYAFRRPEDFDGRDEDEALEARRAGK